MGLSVSRPTTFIQTEISRLTDVQPTDFVVLLSNTPLSTAAILTCNSKVNAGVSNYAN